MTASTTRPDPERRRRAAYHEAGHVVVGWAHDRERLPNYVSIVPHGDFEGSVNSDREAAPGAKPSAARSGWRTICALT